MKYIYSVTHRDGRLLYTQEKKYWLVYWYNKQTVEDRKHFRFWSSKMSYSDIIVTEKDEVWLNEDS